MQSAEGLGRNRQLACARVDEIERAAVALDLFLGAVARPRVPDDQRPEPAALDGHPLDPVGRLDALYERRLPEHPEHLRRLSRKQVLPALRLGNLAHEPHGAGREEDVAQAFCAEGHHDSVRPYGGSGSRTCIGSVSAFTSSQ